MSSIEQCTRSAHERFSLQVIQRMSTVKYIFNVYIFEPHAEEI
jgi:hypothetical protein